MQRVRSFRPFGGTVSASLGCAVAALALAASSTAATPPARMPHHHQMTALYVIDHRGGNPPSDAYLIAYSQAFEKVLTGCRVGVDGLMTLTLNLSDQASVMGGREVSLLSMLQGIARRVTWNGSRSCGYVYNLAEANLEAGNP